MGSDFDRDRLQEVKRREKEKRKRDDREKARDVLENNTKGKY